MVDSTEIMKEISRREKVREIVPDPDIDAYMKVSNERLQFFLKHFENVKRSQFALLSLL